MLVRHAGPMLCAFAVVLMTSVFPGGVETGVIKKENLFFWGGGRIRQCKCMVNFKGFHPYNRALCWFWCHMNDPWKRMVGVLPYW